MQEELIGEYDWFKDLDSVRQEALIDLSFNIGQTRLRGFVKALGYMDMAITIRLGTSSTIAVGLASGDRALEVCQMISSGNYQER